VLGHGGVQKTIEVPLSDEEQEALAKSAQEIRENMAVMEKRGD
jgi:malate/lactate dehydrogenase